MIVSAEAQIFRRLIGVDQFVRVHPVCRIPRGFELAERAHEIVAEHFRQQRAARLSVAMLARKRSAVADNEIGPAIDELRVPPDTLLAFEVEAHLHVNAAVTEMAIERGLIVEFVEQGAQIAQVWSQLLRRDGRIVPTFPAGKRAWNSGGGSWSRLSDFPDSFGFTTVVDPRQRSIRQA